MPPALQQRKQELIRSSLYGVALSLFEKTGFEETTVEDISRESGMSRRTFFRYFESKDDLLSYPVLSFAGVLLQALSTSSASSAMQMLQETVRAGACHATAPDNRTRQVIQVASRSANARRAYESRMREVEEKLAKAFAQKLHLSSSYELQPRILAGLTLAIVNQSILTWCREPSIDIGQATAEIIDRTRRLLNSPTQEPDQSLSRGAADPLPLAKKQTAQRFTASPRHDETLNGLDRNSGAMPLRTQSKARSKRLSSNSFS